jgi:hypothetical protein
VSIARSQSELDTRKRFPTSQAIKTVDAPHTRTRHTVNTVVIALLLSMVTAIRFR